MELTCRSLLSLAAVGLVASAAASLAARAASAKKDASVSADAAAKPTITATPGSADAAAQLMAGLEGTYEPLFPILLSHPEMWREHVSQYVDADAVDDTIAMLQGTSTGTLTGPEAVEAYAAEPDKAAFNCDFPQGIAQLSVADGVVSGYDETGAEVFSYAYAYVAYETTFGFYVFRTDDEDAGEYRYFMPFADTTAETFHIEFRMGSDLDDLLQFRTGAYAFALCAGMTVEHDDELVDKCIELFVRENLGGQE